LGLDIGGTKIKAVALDESGEILSEFSVDSEASQSPDHVRKALHTCVKYFREQGIGFGSIGIGCAGSVNGKTGVVRNSPNFSNWKDVPLRDWMQDDFNVPVTVDNDANCAVYTEWKLGNGKGFDNIVLLTLGTGIGGGIILDGRLFRGATGTGGELGYANGLECACGNRGCFERYCSATAMRRRAGDISSKEVFTHPENPAYAKFIDEYLQDFQVGLVSIANIFDPDIILLGGAVSEGVCLHLPKIEAWVRAHAFPSIAAHTQIQPAKYGNYSGGLGAALMSFAENETTKKRRLKANVAPAHVH
jgi:glucokinase